MKEVLLFSLAETTFGETARRVWDLSEAAVQAPCWYSAEEVDIFDVVPEQDGVDDVLLLPLIELIATCACELDPVVAERLANEGDDGGNCGYHASASLEEVERALVGLGCTVLRWKDLRAWRIEQSRLARGESVRYLETWSPDEIARARASVIDDPLAFGASLDLRRDLSIDRVALARQLVGDTPERLAAVDRALLSRIPAQLAFTSSLFVHAAELLDASPTVDERVTALNALLALPKAVAHDENTERLVDALADASLATVAASDGVLAVVMRGSFGDDTRPWWVAKRLLGPACGRLGEQKLGETFAIEYERFAASRSKPRDLHDFFDEVSPDVAWKILDVALEKMSPSGGRSLLEDVRLLPGAAERASRVPRAGAVTIEDVLVSALDGLEVSLANDLSTLLVVRRDSSPSARVLHIEIASRGEGRDRGHSTQDVVVPTGATEDAARAFAEGVRRAFPRLAQLAGDAMIFPDDVVPLEWLSFTPSLSPDEVERALLEPSTRERMFAGRTPSGASKVRPE
jgi:hypothetical protein